MFSFGLYAQPGPGGDKGKHLKAKKELLQNLSPEEAANLKTKKLTLELNLSESQQNAIYDLELELAKARKTKMEEFKQKKENGELEKPSEEELYQRTIDRLDRQISHKKEMQQILDEEQFQKWERMSKRHEIMKKKMRRHHIRRSR